MKKIIICCLLIIFVIGVAAAGAGEKTIRFAYFEAGDYYLNKVFSREFKEQLRLLKPDSLEIIFEPYGYQSAEWDRQRCRVMARDLARMKNIDMVLAVGPWVVEDLLAADFDRPIIALEQYAVWERGLVDKAGRPIADNLTINVQPLQIDKDLQLLGRLFSPKKVGMFYFPSGDEFEKVKSRAEKAVAQYGAELIAPYDTTASGMFSHFGSYTQVVRRVDALYLPPMYSMHLDQMNQFIENTRYDRLPTVTAEGFLTVEKGIAASGQQRAYIQLARFAAHKTLKIINGATPADLPTIYEPGEQICLNETTLNRLNRELPRRIMKDAAIVRAPAADTMLVYTLSQAIEAALHDNSGHQAILRRFDQAAASARNAHNVYWPELEISAGMAAADENYPAALYNPILNRKYFAAIDLEQTLFSYSALKTVGAAKKDIELSRLDAGQERLKLKQAVVSAYLAVLAAEEKISRLEELLNRIRQYRENARLDAFMRGRDTSDVYIFESYFIGTELDCRRARMDRDIARIILGTLLNRPDHDNIILDKSEFAADVMVLMTNKYESYISDARLKRALEDYFVRAATGKSIGLEQYSLRLESQRDRIAANKGWFWPEVSLRAGLSTGEQFFDDPDDPHTIWSIGGLLRWPLHLWGKSRNEGRALRYEMESLEYAKDSLRFAVAEKVQTRLYEFLACLDILPGVFDHRRTVKAGLEDFYKSYSEGTLATGDMAVMLDKYIASEIRAAAGIYDFYLKYNDLMGAAGTGYLVHGSNEENEFYFGLEKYLGIR